MPESVLVFRRSKWCKLCRELNDVQLREVNAALWDGTQQRVAGYRAVGQKAAAVHGLTVEVKSVTSHAEHVEKGWRTTDRKLAGETQAFPVDYEGTIDRSVRLGNRAITVLESDLENIEPKELVAIAKMGVVASTQRESMRRGIHGGMSVNVLAVFGLASGHMAEIPGSEAIDVTPIDELIDEFDTERGLLVDRSMRDDAATDPEYQELEGAIP